MRRISTLIVLFLVLLFAMPGAVYSLDHPWNFTDSELPDGDDHPWGGEDTGGDPVSPDDNKDGYGYLFTTGSPSVDYTIKSIFIEVRSWFIEKPQRNDFYQERQTRKSRILTAKFDEGR